MPTSPLTPEHAALATLRAIGFPAQRISEVLAFYDEPHRRYHNREHLREIFDASLQLNLGLSPAQTLALLFHDAIYVPGAPRGSNEAMSAHLLRVYGRGLPADLVDAAFGIVIDTAEHVARSPASAFVLDLDLMRLAGSPADFDRYSRQIFDEQRVLIDEQDDAAAWEFFEKRRVAFFERLLQRDAIYVTAQFRATHEAATRANLQAAVARVREKAANAATAEKAANAEKAAKAAKAAKARKSPPSAGGDH